MSRQMCINIDETRAAVFSWAMDASSRLAGPHTMIMTVITDLEGIAVLCAWFKMLSAPVIYQLNAVVFRWEALRRPYWSISDSCHLVSQLERSWKGRRPVAGAKRLGVALQEAWPSDRSSILSIHFHATHTVQTQCHRPTTWTSQRGCHHLNESRR